MRMTALLVGCGLVSAFTHSPPLTTAMGIVWWALALRGFLSRNRVR